MQREEAEREEDEESGREEESGRKEVVEQEEEAGRQEEVEQEEETERKEETEQEEKAGRKAVKKRATMPQNGEIRGEKRQSNALKKLAVLFTDREETAEELWQEVLTEGIGGRELSQVPLSDAATFLFREAGKRNLGSRRETEKLLEQERNYNFPYVAKQWGMRYL